MLLPYFTNKFVETKLIDYLTFYRQIQKVQYKSKSLKDFTKYKREYCRIEDFQNPGNHEKEYCFCAYFNMGFDVPN